MGVVCGKCGGIIGFCSNLPEERLAYGKHGERAHTQPWRRIK